MEIQTTKELMRRYATMEGHVKKFNNQRWVDVNDIIKELTCPEVNEMETVEDAYDYLANKTNNIIDALQNNSKGASHSLNKD